ncbi:MAG: hypothetical protein ACOCRO_07775 [Halanaerobiales bacterium]
MEKKKAFNKARKELKRGIFRAYKLFVFDGDTPKNLYWALEGSRTIKYNQWLEGEWRWARDGGDSPRYVTGIHVMLDKDYVDDYLKNFRTEKDRRLLEVYVQNIRPKPTNNKVFLADRIYIPEDGHTIKTLEELSLSNVV